MAKTKFSKKLNNFNYEPVVHILSILIVILFIINLYFITSLTSSLKQKIVEVEEAARPASIQLTVIQASNCNNCFDIQTIVHKIKQENVNITYTESFDFISAFPIVSELIRKYDIKKLPTIIVKGELAKSGLNNTLEPFGDSLIFTKQNPPYFDTEVDRVIGLVTATILNADNCLNCTDINPLLLELESAGIVVQNIVNLSEKEGNNLIRKYDIKKLPSLILSNDALEYDLIKQNWKSLGTKEQDESLVLREIPPPYKNLETGKIDGLVSLTNIVDSSCKDCYDINLHRQILRSYNLMIISEKNLDVATPEGFAYVQANNITLVPTIVLSKESKIYTAFYRIFTQVSKEVNANLIFTSLDLMGKYKNLETGEIVEP